MQELVETSAGLLSVLSGNYMHNENQTVALNWPNDVKIGQEIILGK
jgi:hypothetical protein